MNHLVSIGIIGLWISFLLIIAIISKRNLPEAKELSRKIVHIGIGPVIPLAWWLSIPQALAISAALFITACLFINQQLQVITAIEDIQRKSFGTTAYGLSITILLILFWQSQTPAVCAGVLVMAFGDGLAGLIGKYFKSAKWRILGQTKSIIGTSTMFLVSLIILTCISFASGYTLDPIRISIIAAAGTILEQISPLGLDNLTVPIGVGYAWVWIN